MATAKNAKKENDIEFEKRFSRFLEEIKITNDYMKHIGTLDSGAIVIMATFMDRFIQPKESNWAVGAIFLFCLSLIGALALQGILALRLSNVVDHKRMFPDKADRYLFFSFFFIALFAFLGGMISLGAYVAVNTPFK